MFYIQGKKTKGGYKVKIRVRIKNTENRHGKSEEKTNREKGKGPHAPKELEISTKLKNTWFIIQQYTFSAVQGSQNYI